MLSNVNEENFEEEVIYSEIPAVVDFWAKKCPPCIVFGPIFEKLSKKYKGRIKFLKCRVGKNRGLADLFDVKSIPTILFFCEGEITKRIKGKRDTASMEKELKDLLKRC